MTKKAKCPYCGMEEPMDIDTDGAVYQGGAKIKMYRFKCPCCSKAFWRHEKAAKI